MKWSITSKTLLFLIQDFIWQYLWCFVFLEQLIESISGCCSPSLVYCNYDGTIAVLYGSFLFFSLWLVWSLRAFWGSVYLPASLFLLVINTRERKRLENCTLLLFGFEVLLREICCLSEMCLKEIMRNNTRLVKDSTFSLSLLNYLCQFLSAFALLL